MLNAAAIRQVHLDAGWDNVAVNDGVPYHYEHSSANETWNRHAVLQRVSSLAPWWCGVRRVCSGIERRSHESSDVLVVSAAAGRNGPQVRAANSKPLLGLVCAAQRAVQSPSTTSVTARLVTVSPSAWVRWLRGTARCGHWGALISPYVTAPP